MALPSVAPSRPVVSHADLLRQIDACTALMLENQRHLRLLLAFTALPEGPLADPIDACEICDRPVDAADLSGYGRRNGATCHVNCLTAQLDTRF